MSAAALRARLGIRSSATAVERVGSVLRRVVLATGRGSVIGSIDDRAIGQRAIASVLGALAAPLVVGSARLGIRILGAVMAAWLVGRVEARAGSRRAESVLPELPAVLDRLVLCTMSGASVDAALRVVAPGAPGPLGDALRAAVDRLDAGGTRRAAYRRMIATVDDTEVRTLALALERSERLGVPAADALAAHARACRARVRAIAEANIAAAPLKLVFPLVFCFLPAFVVLAVGPVALSAIRTLSAL